MDRLFCVMNQRKATKMGVVRQAVKMSAGNLGLVGKSSLAAQGAKTIQSRWVILDGKADDDDDDVGVELEVLFGVEEERPPPPDPSRF